MEIDIVYSSRERKCLKRVEMRYGKMCSSIEKFERARVDEQRKISNRNNMWFVNNFLRWCRKRNVHGNFCTYVCMRVNFRMWSTSFAQAAQWIQNVCHHLVFTQFFISIDYLSELIKSKTEWLLWQSFMHDYGYCQCGKRSMFALDDDCRKFVCVLSFYFSIIQFPFALLPHHQRLAPMSIPCRQFFPNCM